ncbi:MAG: HAMP domain-containing protein [Nitrospirae bacterium]|nr:HAMP domain-containing protein [Nitrospirota bacterium]
MEKRQKVIGSRFRTKIVAIFTIIVLIPSVLLFFVSSGLINRYIDRWLNPQIKAPIENALFLARALYDRERERTLMEAHRIAKGRPPSPQFKITWLKKLPEQYTETLKSAFEGKEGTEVISRPAGDIIRAVKPIIRKNKVVKVLVVEEVLPLDIVQKAEQIRTDYENYISLYKWRFPLKANYLLALGFFTLLVIFMALWVALRISRWITEPIQRLAFATEEVGKGNLHVNLNIQRDDEIGLLVESFNRMVNDLRESKESLQNAYLESDRRRICFESIVENIDSGVISINENQEILTINLTINTAACSILNVQPEEVIGKSYTVLLALMESDELKDFIKKIDLKDFSSTSKQLKVTINGRVRTLKITITQIKDAMGRSLGLLAVFEDITELLKAQQALAWQEVARRIAHEIKNPLTPIKLSTERILKKWKEGSHDLDRVLETATRTIIREVEGLQRLVNEFSRLGRMPRPTPSPCNVNDIIKEVISLYDNINKKITLSSDNVPPVNIDREQFKRAIINLIDNAITATKDGGIINIKVSFDSQRELVVLKVSDTGVGMDEEVKDKLFLPYFSTKKEGTGLGLAIVHKIIKDHGGEIRAEDNIPRGTVFTIELPAQADDEQRNTQIQR